MKTKQTVNKQVGRPRASINKEDFEKLCNMHCTSEEISYFFNVSPPTLTEWCKREYGESFLLTYKRFEAGGKCSLRRLLWQHAETSGAVCMFLAKNVLGYRDNGCDDGEDDKNACDKIAEALYNICDRKANGNSDRETANSN